MWSSFKLPVLSVEIGYKDKFFCKKRNYKEFKEVLLMFRWFEFVMIIDIVDFYILGTKLSHIFQFSDHIKAKTTHLMFYVVKIILLFLLTLNSHCLNLFIYWFYGILICFPFVLHFPNLNLLHKYIQEKANISKDECDFMNTAQFTYFSK